MAVIDMRPLLLGTEDLLRDGEIWAAGSTLMGDNDFADVSPDIKPNKHLSERIEKLLLWMSC